jgi:DNA-binding winged helix-turn-helix (wHTH) protein
LLSEEKLHILLGLWLKAVGIKTELMGSVQYTFGEFELDAAAFQLLQGGERIKLERIPMELLLLLVSRHGELVSREEIVDKLWGREIFIDTNTAINVAIRKIRQVLGDNLESPRYILTVPAKGYRFIGEISS